MQKMIVMLSVLIAIPVTTWSLSTGGATQETRLQAAQNAPQLKSAEGELSRVETRNQLLWIKTADGKEMEFAYTDQTKVEGTGGSVEGLANMSGSFLKIQYHNQGATNVAVQIQVQPKKG
jgi:hypothetical protein